MMKKFLLLFLCTGFLLRLTAQTTTPTPDKLWGKLFQDVQMQRVFPDNKTFVDCIPKSSPAVILKKYASERTKPGFALDRFVHENFTVPSVPDVQVTGGLSLTEHLNQLWEVLTRKADTVRPYNSLLPLAKPYIVPGGRFREIYYWDSYFTMQGLAVSNRYDMIENMIDNFSMLIQKYGHIPNGNRNYYLGRSQPPYFAMMVELLHQKSGDEVYRKYFSSMEKEYAFWMDGSSRVVAGKPFRRVVKMPDGSVLNRHWDDVNAPRQESYAEDVATAKNYKGKRGQAYVNLRASAESGWDFCSRWFEDTLHLNTIETTEIVPVDLNALLFAYETVLAKAATFLGQASKAEGYQKKSEKRKASVMKYCWKPSMHYFFDYDAGQKHTTNKWSIAGVMPLFTKMVAEDIAIDVQQQVDEKFVKDGGVVTTIYHTGEQWDAPNGWAPLQFLAVKGLLNYGFDSLAKNIADRWMMLNEKVFASTGKMLEKYNVENLNLDSGGGEYPTQDGFGWSNGVYLAFYNWFKKDK